MGILDLIGSMKKGDIQSKIITAVIGLQRAEAKINLIMSKLGLDAERAQVEAYFKLELQKQLEAMNKDA